MKDDKRAKRYITLICNHLSKLGYTPELKGTVSRYTKIGDTGIRISDHFGFEKEIQLNIIISRYTKEIIVIINNNPTVYPTIKEAKDFLSSFVFYKETCEQYRDVIAGKVGAANKELNDAKQAFELEKKKLEGEKNKLATQLEESKKETKSMETKWLNAVKQNSDLVSGKQSITPKIGMSDQLVITNDVAAINLSTVTPKGREKIMNELKPVKMTLKKYRVSK